MILIRTMRSSDLAWAADIESRVFARPWSEADFEKDLENERKLLLVALSDCRPIGYAQCVRAADEADIARVCVEEEFRKKGIATQLLTELFRLCEEEGVVKFFLEVRESNAAARALYDRLGFVQTGVRRSYYEEPDEDAILMARLPEKKLPGKRYA